MSYFVAISGARASTIVPERGRLVASVDAQAYFRHLASAIEVATGQPVFLWDDGQSDTSDDLICNACDEVQLLGKNSPGSTLTRLFESCESAGCSVHIWWPTRLESLGGIRALPISSSAHAAVEQFVSQAAKGQGICLAMLPNYALERTDGTGIDVS